MENEPRKATEVLLQLESKVDSLVNTINALDFNIKVLSNKLNEIMKSLETRQSPPKIIVEAVQNPAPLRHSAAAPLDPERAIPITAMDKLPQTEAPQGFRRTSRPETYDKQAQKSLPAASATPPLPTPQFPIQMPKPPPGRSVGETVVAPPPEPKSKTKVASPSMGLPIEPTENPAVNPHHVVPVEQRVVDRNGKSVFLADVEVINLETSTQVVKTRTNGMGKWMSPLPIGVYQITIRKHELVTKTTVETMQTIKIDGSQSPLKLQTVIIK